MNKLIFGGLAAAAALSLAACNKPASEPADAVAPAAAPASPSPAASEPAAASAASTLPADMQAHAEHAELCEHFAGEEPYDADRRKQIEDAIEANCTPLKAALPGLIAAHGADPALKPTLDRWAELVQ